MEPTKTNKQINELIRGAKSAHEAYGEAIDKVSDRKELDKLQSMRKDHREAFETFRSMGFSFEGKSEADSGAWGTFTQSVMKTPRVFGDKATLKALKTGEELGKKQYERALEKDDLPAQVKIVLKEKLIPTQERHIREIDQILDAA